MCLKMQRTRQNPLSQHAASCVWGGRLVGHIADKGVTWRRVALAEKRWKKRKVGEGEGKLLEKCGKMRKKKREGKREKGD